MVPENLTQEQIAEARERLKAFACSLGRISAKVCHDMGIQFDMDDPDVAREVMRLTFDALFYSAPLDRSTKKAARSGSRRTSDQA